jgi:hypothetical protein
VSHTKQVMLTLCEHLGSSPVVLVMSVLLICLVFCVVLCYFVLVCLRPVSCVPDVASASGLSILDRPFCFLECLFKSDERDI